jgi:hypothetical protein
MAAYERLEDDEKHFGENYVQEVGPPSLLILL